MNGPKAGRWLNRDPIGEAEDINLYGFLSNNSIDWIDYLGLCTVEVHYNKIKATFGAYHTFLIITDLDGSQMIFRSGPGGSGGSMQSLANGKQAKRS